MTTTGRDRARSLALLLARRADDRGYLRAITPEIVADAAADRDLDVSSRTIRRALEAMRETGVLVDVDGPGKRYRLAPDLRADPDDVALSSNVSPNDREAVDTSVDIEQTARQEPGDTSDDAPELRLDDISDADLDSLTSGDRPLIYHLFADVGVESEPLSAFGRVVRVGWDPQATPFGDVIQADALAPPLDPVADLVVCHPYCQPWSPIANGAGVADDYPKQITAAREVASELGDEYVIENVPAATNDDEHGLEAPDGGDLVTLSGNQFGLPVPYRRAFETSFPIRWIPPAQKRVSHRESPFADPEDGRIGEFRGDVDAWRAVKQVSGDYPARELKHAGIPAPYIYCLCYNWLLERRDQEAATNLSTPPASGGGPA